MPTYSPNVPYFENVISEFAGKSKREKIKAIRLEAQREIDFDLLENYRFVSTKCLNVRKRASIKSPVLGKLYFGQVVKIGTKGRKWSLIEFKVEDTGLKVEGWVFSRYLANFTK